MDNRLYIEIIGFIAAAFTTSAFLPQAYKVWKTKDVESLSLPMYLILVTGVILWVVYGIYLKSPAIIAANSVTFIATLYILINIIRYNKN